MARPLASRLKARRYSALELATGFALTGSLAAVAVPVFVREVHSSRLVEPIDGLGRLGASAVAYANVHPVSSAFPPSAPMTPSIPPRGHCEPSAPDAWRASTWRALDFHPIPVDAPHCFAFTFDSSLSPTRSTFRADAHGDLNGNGIFSTFEVSGHAVDGDPAGPALDPGMFVDSEVE
jgi:hypothetical protein